MRDVALEVRRTMNGWIVEYPGGEDCFTDGTRRGFSMSTIHTDITYDFEEMGDGSLLIHVHKPPALRKEAGDGWDFVETGADE